MSRRRFRLGLAEAALQVAAGIPAGRGAGLPSPADQTPLASKDTGIFLRHTLGHVLSRRQGGLTPRE